MNETPNPLDTVTDSIAAGTPSDIEFGSLAGTVFAYLVGPAPPRHVALFMDLAAGVRDRLRAKELAHKAERYLAAFPNPTDADLGQLAKIAPEAFAPFLEGVSEEQRELLARKLLAFPGPKPVPEAG